MINVAITGFGRIGKVLLRQILNSKNIRVVAINDLNSDINNIAYLIKYDTTYGKINTQVKVEGKNLIINSNKIKYSNYSKINQVNWNKFRYAWRAVNSFATLIHRLCPGLFFPKSKYYHSLCNFICSMLHYYC